MEFDTTNLFIVTADGHGADQRIIIMRRPAIISKRDALNLVAWVSVLAELTDEEVLAARRAVKGT